MSDDSPGPQTLKAQLRAIYSALTEQVGVDPGVLRPLLLAIDWIDRAQGYDYRADELVRVLQGIGRLKLKDNHEPDMEAPTSVAVPAALRAHIELIAVLGFLGEIGVGPELMPGLVETRYGLASIAVGRAAPIFKLAPKEAGGRRGLDLHTGYLRSAAAVAVSMLIDHKVCSKTEALRRISAELARREEKDITPDDINSHRDEDRYKPSMVLANDRLEQIQAAAEEVYQASREWGMTEQEAAEVAADTALDWAVAPPKGRRSDRILGILRAHGFVPSAQLASEKLQ